MKTRNNPTGFCIRHIFLILVLSLIISCDGSNDHKSGSNSPTLENQQVEEDLSEPTEDITDEDTPEDITTDGPDEIPEDIPDVEQPEVSVAYSLECACALEDDKNSDIEAEHRLITEQTIVFKRQKRVNLLQATPMYRDTISINFTKLEEDEKSGILDIAVCGIAPDGTINKVDEFSIPPGNSGGTETIKKRYAGISQQRLSLQFKGRSNNHKSKLMIDLMYSENEGNPWIPFSKEDDAEPAKGFLDLHIHQTGAMAFNGGWYWGSHMNGPLNEMLPPCDGEHGSFHEFEFLLHIPATKEIVYGIAPKGDVDDFLKSHRNRTEPDQYVRSDDRKHQQVAFERLKEAHERGMSLILSTVVENHILTDLMKASGKGRTDWHTATMESIKRQIVSLREIDDAVDWFEVVYDPWHARRAINQGKLAVVIGAEFSNLFPLMDGPWKQQLYDLYDLGLRHLQPVHKTDSQFNATHNQGFPFDIANFFRALTMPEIPIYPAIERFLFGAEEPTKGLTSAGFSLLDEMVKLHMIVDLSHSGTVSQIESTDYLINKHNYYPMIYSHWAAKNLDLLEKLKTAGGMIALGWGNPVPKSTHSDSTVSEPIEQNCIGHLQSLYNDYKNFVDYGVNFTLATDMNGFTSVRGPNFGPDSCFLTTEEKDRTDQVKTHNTLKEKYPNHPDWVARYWAQGTADISLLPGVIYDLKEVIGVDTSVIESSAETFLKMWERTYDENREKIE